MKRFLLIILLVPVIGFSQSLKRTNSTKAEVVELNRLEHAKGFAFIEGEWLEFDKNNDYQYEPEKKSNCIPNAFFFARNLNGYTNSSVSRSRNFISLSVNYVLHEKEQYLVLIEETVSGLYKYPSIREGWYTFDEMKVYVIDFDEWNDFTENALKELNVAKRYNLPLLMYSSFRSDLDGMDIEKNVSIVLSGGRETTDILFFNLFPVDIDGSKYVRFTYQKEPIGRSSFDPLIFDDSYFETPLENFARFIE